MKIDRTGEKRVMNCGLEAEIIAYRGTNDIDVKFEDGYIAYNKQYTRFKKGMIKSHLEEENRLGEERLMSCGLKAKIIKYNNAKDIDVEFEDGVVVKHKPYSSFIIGRILNNDTTIYGRIGEEKIMKNGLKAKIISVKDWNNVEILFEDGYRTTISATQFNKGMVKNPFIKSVYGIGYLGATVVDKKSYEKWSSMISRCYNDKCTNYKNYGAKGITVCEEWHCYANFKKWYDENYYEIDNEKVELDKDILFKNNKIYSPETCIFVPKYINNLFGGVFKDCNNKKIKKTESGKYTVNIQTRHNNRNLGVFDTIEKAREIYNYNRLKLIEELTEEYKKVIPLKLYNRLKEIIKEEELEGGDLNDTGLQD